MSNHNNTNSKVLDKSLSEFITSNVIKLILIICVTISFLTTVVQYYNFKKIEVQFQHVIK